MVAKFSTYVKDLINKNTAVFILVVGIVGCGVGFFVSGKRTSSGCVLATNTPNESISSEENIVVDLSGAVSKPGVYKLKTSSRVGDLINAGGGVVGDVSKTWLSKSLNLAKKLDDATKVYIPFEWEISNQENYEVVKTAASNTLATSNDNVSVNNDEDTGMGEVSLGGKINVNTATASDLDSLSGIGPAYAEKIIAERPYTDLEDFKSRSGLWESTIAGIENLIVF